MKTKAILTSIFIGTMLLAASPVDAQRGQGPGSSENGTCDYIPDLTEVQEEQIDQIKADYFSAIKDLKADMAIKTAEKRKLMIADQPDKAAINAKIDEISAIHNQMAKKRVEKHLAIRDILTEEQKNVFDAKMHKGHMGGNMHPNRMHDMPARHKDCMYNNDKMHKNR